MQQGLMSLLSMTTPVMVIGNDQLDGKPIITPILDVNNAPKTDLNGNALGSIRLEQHIRELNGTFLNARKRVAFVGGTVEELSKVVATAKLKDGSTLPGKIVIMESLDPMYKGHQPKINPQTQETIGVTVNGKLYPVYMQMKYVENATIEDVLIRDEEAVNNWLVQNGGAVPAATVEETATIPVD
jgi:hypothetical protein